VCSHDRSATPRRVGRTPGASVAGANCLEGTQQEHRARGCRAHDEAVVQTDLEADREVANTLTDLIIGVCS
jgi:hypothetical protein